MAHKREKSRRSQLGATTVEFAFAMLFVFFFFIAFYEIVEIFLAHQRVTYAAHLASRAYQVHGDASAAADFVENDFELQEENDSVMVSKEINVPIDFEDPFEGGKFREAGTTFTVARRVKTFVEPEETGDNR